MKLIRLISGLLLSTAFVSLLSTSALATKPSAPEPIVERPAKIQVALLLDTSSSMDGLISQAKSQLWMLVNELGEGEKNGVKPDIELALYEYGNSNLSVSSGYIRQILPLTTDLDDVSEKLFALTTQGGSEHAGQVITAAIEELEWTNGFDDLRLVIIAGNERFTQGPIHYESACARAQKKNIIIDTIHCGDERQGIAGKWKAGADCGGGVYMTINQDEESVYIASPYDDDLLELNKRLNKTYLGYGKKGAEYKLRQETQDKNAGSVSPKSSIQRLYSKSSSQYNNSSWDIVDAYEENSDRILGLSDESLPDDMQGMTRDQRKAFIEKTQAERAAVKAEIAKFEAQREAYVVTEKATMEKTNTLDEIVVTAVKKQAKDSGFSYED